MSASAQNYAYIFGKKKEDAKPTVMPKEEYEKRIAEARRYLKKTADDKR